MTSVTWHKTIDIKRSKNETFNKQSMLCKHKIPFQSKGLTSQNILLLYKIRLEHAMVDLIFIWATYILSQLPRFLWLEIAFPRKAIYSYFLVPQLHSPSICASLLTDMNLRQNTTVLKIQLICLQPAIVHREWLYRLIAFY